MMCQLLNFYLRQLSVLILLISRQENPFARKKHAHSEFLPTKGGTLSTNDATFHTNDDAFPTNSSREFEYQLDFTIRGYSSAPRDSYVCIAKQVTRQGYIVELLPVAHTDRVRQIMLLGCPKPTLKQGMWDCTEKLPCEGRYSLLYTWAHNHHSFALPLHTGIAIGVPGETEYLTMYVHYSAEFSKNTLDYSGFRLHLINKRPANLVYILELASLANSLTDGKLANINNATCAYNGKPELYPFAFSTHTRLLGGMVSASVYRQGKWSLLGKRNSLWPQYFEEINKQLQLSIKAGDVLAAQCRYDLTPRQDGTDVSNFRHDEVCNFMMMYYVAADGPQPFKGADNCVGSLESGHIMELYPKRNSVANLFEPRNLTLERAGLLSTTYFGITNKATWSQFEDTWTEWTSSAEKLYHQEKLNFSQIVGLFADSQGDVWILDRGSRVWNATTFDSTHHLIDKTAISQHPVIRISSKTGKLIRRFGSGQFFVPTAITVSQSDHVWITDAGAHRVAEFTRRGQLLRAWGKAFVAGNGKDHFCKPLAVAVLHENGFIVADGPCNDHRLMRFDSNGEFVNEISMDLTGASNTPLPSINLKTDIIVDPMKRTIMVVDPRNRGITGISYEGDPLFRIPPPFNYTTVDSVDYDSMSHTYYVLSKSVPLNGVNVTRAFALQGDTFLPLFSWSVKSHSFGRTSIIRLAPDRQTVYIANGTSVTKFQIEAVVNELTEDGFFDSISTNAHIPLLLLAAVIAFPALLLLAKINFKKRTFFPERSITAKGTNSTQDIISLLSEDIEVLDEDERSSQLMQSHVKLRDAKPRGKIT